MSTSPADTAETRFVAGPSATFAYRRIGPRGGVPLILLNRFRGTIDWWDPQLLDHLAAEHDVIVFDDIGVGYSTGTPRDSVEGFTDGAIEFIEALGLPRVDLLGWTLGGLVAQYLTRRRPDLVRKLILAASNLDGRVPGAPDPDPKVRAVLSRPEVGPDDLVSLFFPDTDTGRAAGHAHLSRVARRLATGRPEVSETAGANQFAAIGKSAAIPFDRTRADLEAITHPVLYATGMRDAMIPALSAYVAVQHLADATLVIYGDAGHAFLFQHAKDFAIQVSAFLAA
ncbi:alpha/beta fold hydrolase [Amycolatopsis kentuckyensis]|uniref:alpha/beta fold hydrolase n=1 Tax=Amycolatopsis kentuckyensis TaxID=218823 RepID=UPI000A387A13|nr:alpha/beta hydrolase [Amycolatopsis kentuckyensis]